MSQSLYLGVVDWPWESVTGVDGSSGGSGGGFDLGGSGGRIELGSGGNDAGSSGDIAILPDADAICCSSLSTHKTPDANMNTATTVTIDLSILRVFDFLCLYESLSK